MTTRTASASTPGTGIGETTPPAVNAAAGLVAALDTLADRRVLLFGGKGGVGKTTMAAAAALHFASTRHVILFATDPASNLGDLFGSGRIPHLTVESLDAVALYRDFLADHLPWMLEIGDRGTYLDRDELRRFFELSVPGIDELMAWMRVCDLAETEPEALIVVDTAPTGHTLRMLDSGSQFERLAEAFDALAEKHRAIVRQFARRTVRDSVDEFIEKFARQAESRRALMADSTRTAFVPVTLGEPWVVEQTVRLVEELGASGASVPFVILNRAVSDPDCERDRQRVESDRAARSRFAMTVDAPRACRPLDSPAAVLDYLAGSQSATRSDQTFAASAVDARLKLPRVAFFAGKGGVGKTTCAASVALQLARGNPGRRFVVISVDPAHAILDVFATEPPPSNLVVETIDTRAKWRHLRSRLGDEIERAVDALTPARMSVSYDAGAMKSLLEIGPPGADEIFAVSRLAELVRDPGFDAVIVDTAPTGHFLRLLELPRTAGEWVRELMRLLLRYRELVAPGELGQELTEASRALRDLDAVIHTGEAGVVVVTRPEAIVVSETERLIAELRQRGVAVAGTIANYVTPAGECACDAAARTHELAALASLGPAVAIARRDRPVTGLDELTALVPLA